MLFIIVFLKLDTQFLLQETLCHIPKQSRSPASVLVPFKLDYKDLDNERNYNLTHPFSDDSNNSIAYDVEDGTDKASHREYMECLLSILKEVPSVERPCKIISAMTLPSNSTIHPKSMVRQHRIVKDLAKTLLICIGCFFIFSGCGFCHYCSVRQRLGDNIFNPQSFR